MMYPRLAGFASSQRTAILFEGQSSSMWRVRCWATLVDRDIQCYRQEPRSCAAFLHVEPLENFCRAGATVTSGVDILDDTELGLIGLQDEVICRSERWSAVMVARRQRSWRRWEHQKGYEDCVLCVREG